MKFDLVYAEIGEFGLYQKGLVYIRCLTSFYCGMLFINSFFVLAIPKHRCAIPGLHNDTFAVQDAFHSNLINSTIPPSAEDDLLYDQCHVYVTSSSGQRESMKCDRWVYDRSIFESTLAAELNLVCERTVYKSNAQMAFFGGLLIGSFVSGLISDRIGRKPTMCMSIVVVIGFAIAIAWTPSILAYSVLVFFFGVFSVGMFMPAFVMGMEFVGPSKRRLAGILGAYFWIVGNVILALLGYLIRDWRTLQLACALPGVLLLSFWYIMPESPRWLYTQKRFAESEKIIRKTAKINKANISESFYEKVFRSGDTVEAEPPKDRIWHLFADRQLAIRTLILFFNWLVVCLAYYGLALNSGDIGGDLFLNFFLQAVIEIPATLIVYLLIDRVGRKPVLVLSMIIGGIGCIATIFTITYGGPEMQIMTTVLALIGKTGASAGFTMVYVYSAEIFPTAVRNAGMGSSSCMARVGGMIAPYIADLDRLISGPFSKALPQLVFGVLSVIAGLMSLYLPETLNTLLPETLEDGKNFGKTKQSNTKTIYVNEAFEDKDMKTHL